MDYASLYERLIARSSCRKRGALTERHHIKPRCLGGSNAKENIANLTPREHYLAHLLLVKIYPDVHGLKLAVILMSGRCKTRKSRAYEAIRDAAMAERSARQKGKPRPRHVMEAMWAAVRGVPMSAERRRAISERNTGMKISPEARRKSSESHRGRKNSEEHRLKSAKGQSSLPDETIIAMRSAYDAGGVMDHISRSHGVSLSLGSRIMKRQSYKWVT